MISYEVSIGFIIVNVCIRAGSFNLSSIILAQKHLIQYIFIAYAYYFLCFRTSILTEPYQSKIKKQHYHYNASLTREYIYSCMNLP
jgi:NADH:ubiquinone oxidoreductase subunit H